MASEPNPHTTVSGLSTARTDSIPSDTLLPPGNDAVASLRLHAADILENIGDAVVVLGRDWRILYANREACRINQKPREEFIGKIHWDEWPASVGTELERQYRRAMDEGLEVHFEHRYVAEPYDVWMEVDVYPSDEGINIFYRDITIRKQAEQALRRSQEDLRLAVDAAQIGTFYCDYPLDKIVWNETCSRHFFLPADAEVDFSLFYSLLHPDDREPTRQAIERALAGRVEYDVEYRTLAPDRRTRWVNAIGRFHYNDAGEPSRFDGITLDISPRKAIDESLRRRAEREALLNRIGQSLRNFSDSEQILETAVRELGEALGVDRCYYTSYDQDDDRATIGPDWHRAGLTSLAGEYTMSRFGVNQDPVYKAGKTQIIAEVRGDAATLSLGLRALVRVPLVSGTGMTALALAMADGPRAWTGEEVSLVEAVATQTQTALEAALTSRRERAIAQQLQNALQPALPSRILGLSLGSFTRPALDEASVGGDFYDVFPLDKNLYALVIGDVSGKGLAAAQQLALIRNSLRTTLYLYRNPAQAVTSLNAIVSAHDLLVGFVTAWVGVYDAITGQITYASCGHEPGLVRRQGGAVEELETMGPPLGIAQNADYGELTVTLLSGDTLLLYTDGISEAGPSRRELLATPGLKRLLAGLPDNAEVQEQAAMLVAEVSGFAGGVFRDDVAVLLAQRQ